MLSPFETWRTPSPGVGGPSASGIEPAKTAVELPVSVKVTSSGVDSVSELVLTCAVSGALAATLRFVSTTLMLAVVEDWVVGLLILVMPGAERFRRVMVGGTVCVAVGLAS